MTKIDIFSGFLGAGKTTLIKKLIKEAYNGEKLVLIENEFGEIGIDGGFLKEAGIEITEMNSGCICCSLVGDFGKALKKVIDEFSPDRILIEPSGVGKLTDVIKATQEVLTDDVVLNSYTTVVDAKKCKIYHKNFGEFFNDQIKSASAVILSHTDDIAENKLEVCVGIVKELNPEAVIVTTPWKDITGVQILSAVEKTNTLSGDLEKLMKEHEHHHHEHNHEHHHEHGEHCTCGCHDHDHEHEHHEHHHEHGEHCTCGCHDHEHEHEHHEHHHEHGEHCTCGCHEHEQEHEHHEHHHEHGEHCTCGCHDHDHEHEHHEHHHEHGEHCSCGCHDHEQEHEHHEHHHEHGEHCSCSCHDHDHNHGHGHHHADDVFTSWGKETTKAFTIDEIREILESFTEEAKFGIILRAKGIVAGKDGKWIHFDYVPGEPDVRTGAADITGRLCVIGSKINEESISEIFGI